MLAGPVSMSLSQAPKQLPPPPPLPSPDSLASQQEFPAQIWVNFAEVDARRPDLGPDACIYRDPLLASSLSAVQAAFPQAQACYVWLDGRWAGLDERTAEQLANDSSLLIIRKPGEQFPSNTGSASFIQDCGHALVLHLFTSWTYQSSIAMSGRLALHLRAHC